MAVRLKIFTLNTWGLPFPVICKNRLERMRAIASYLKSQDYDIIILEEVWVKSDFNHLKETLNRTHHAHYFYSGTIGSGICVFSKHPIIETGFHHFHLNGQAHKIFHGDWFGGKGIGLCRIKVDDLDVNLYCTHFHAEYNPGNDEYLAHRTCQAFELSQFVRSTMDGCDLVLVAGDLNTKPHTLSYRLITQNSGLKDSWLTKTNKVENEFGGTCDVPGNSYTSSDCQKTRPQGERIDYVLYKGRKDFSLKVTCETGLDPIPDLGISYSDHEAVMATLTIKEDAETQDVDSEDGLNKEVKETFQDALLVLDKGISQCLGEEKFFQLMIFLLSLALYFVSCHVDQSALPGGFLVAILMALIKVALAIGIGFSIWEALIVKRAEFYGLVATKEDIKRMLQTGGYQSRVF